MTRPIIKQTMDTAFIMFAQNSKQKHAYIINTTIGRTAFSHRLKTC